MATINFLYRSTRENAPLTLRLLYRYQGKDHCISAKIKLLIEKRYWSEIHFSNTRDTFYKSKKKEINDKLHELEKYVLKTFNNHHTYEVDKEWLVNVVDEYYNPQGNLNENVVYWIQKIIKEAHIRDNSKGGIGLSKGRISSYERLLELFKDFQGNRRYKISQLNIKTFNAFKLWLLDTRGYAATYSMKKLSDLKTVCKEAKIHGVETSSDLLGIKVKQPSAYDDDMDVITLSEDEIEKIGKLELKNDALINARKWLILACYTGQRGETLSRRLSSENFERIGKDLIIKIIQKKGNKPIQIPVLPKVREIYEGGMPYSVSTQKLNKYFKKLGELAKLNDEVLGRLDEDVKGKGRRAIKGLRPKWQYLSTHIGRRSFATIHYKKIPTPVIMRVTGHTKESTFLGYINQSDNSHIDTFMDYYSKRQKKELKESQLTVVPKNAS